MVQAAGRNCLQVTDGSSAPAADDRLRTRRLNSPSAKPIFRRLRELSFRQFISATLFLFFLFFLGAFALRVEALEVPPPPDTYVTDKANILAPETEARLELILAQFEAATSNQIVIATFPSLEGESLEDFSIRVAERWKVGQKDKDNGVVVLIFRDDHLVRIEVGYGLEGVLPDALAGQIIQTRIIPYFKEGKFDQGVLAGTQAILQATQGEFKGTGGIQGAGASQGTEGIVILVLFIAFVLLLVDTIRYSFYFFGRRTIRDRYGWIEWFIRFSVLLALLNILIRILIYSALSRGGGYSGGRGGFSGGGGSFGGGGASGRW